VAAGLALAALAMPAGAQQVTDRRVDDAVTGAFHRLMERIHRQTGAVETKFSRQHPGGVEALVVLAAMEGGFSLDHPNLKAAVAYLQTVDPQTTYARAMRAMVFARLEGDEARKRLLEDVDWLLKQQARTGKGGAGGWGYGPEHPTTKLRADWTDASNTYFALRALSDAAEAGAPVPPTLWRRAMQYWMDAQNDDGGWGYEPRGQSAEPLRGSSHGSMTAAGVATNLLLAGRIAETTTPPPGPRADNPPPNAATIQRGLAWLGKHLAVDQVPQWTWGSSEDWLYYWHYFLARTAEEGGLREIGPHDWYPQMAELLFRRQRHGMWTRADAGDETLDVPVRTAFALLALVKGRRAVLVNKLDLDGTALVGNDCRDAANAVRWLSRQSGPACAWQLVRPDAAPAVFAEAPVLYLVGGPRTRLPQVLADRVRQFVHDGGTVLVQAFGGDRAFAEHAREFFVQALPGCRAGTLPPEHPVYSARMKIAEAKRFEVLGIGDSCRTRVFVAIGDLSGAWHHRRIGQNPEAFEFFANLIEYATDGQLPTRRLDCRLQAPAPARPEQWISISRVRHAGDWDVCPQAFDRLSEALTRAVSIGVKAGPPVDLSSTPHAPLLWLTGSGGLDLPPAQRESLRKYLADGGTLFADSAWGRPAFAEAVEAMLVELFGRDAVKPLSPDSPLLSGDVAGGMGSDLRKVAYSRHVAEEVRAAGEPVLKCLELNGRVAAVLSPYGVTCPMAGLPAFGCQGLSQADALRLAANVVYYAFAPGSAQAPP